MNTVRQRNIGPDVQARRQKVPPVNIDPQLFWETLQAKVGGNSLSELGDELNITSSTFTRIKYAAEGIVPKYRPNLPTYLTLCWWMGVSPNAFVVKPEHKNTRVRPVAGVSLKYAP